MFKEACVRLSVGLSVCPPVVSDCLSVESYIKTYMHHRLTHIPVPGFPDFQCRPVEDHQRYYIDHLKCV